ncbi:MAG: IgGFc-binding protein [Myxococcota bacterium]|jgi:hypothetical protein|nr:IgGFc-binding protein [Myxococcota bacterium]
MRPPTSRGGQFGFWALLLASFASGCADDAGAPDGALPPRDGGVEADLPTIIEEPCTPGVAGCRDLEHRQVCRDDGAGWTVTRCVDEAGQQQSCVEGVCRDRVCPVPGEFQSCVDDKTQLRCNATGTAYEEVPCEGACTEPAGCQGQVCRPGKRRCQDDDLLEECTAAGTGWLAVQSCREISRVCAEGGETGAQCTELCEVARKERSYIGCEYWAVDLDNAFVPGDSASGYHDAQGKQFAVVVSNVDQQFDAFVRIATNEGPVYCTEWADIPEEQEGAFDYDPEAVWCAPDYERCLALERCTTVTQVDAQGKLTWRDVCTSVGRLECREEIDVSVNHLRIFNLTRRDVNGTIQAPLAFQVQSSIPINAYQFNPLENQQVFSNDASLLLPINALGKNYLVMTREQTFADLKSYLTVIAVLPGTTDVYVTPTVRTLPGTGIPALARGQRKRFTMKQFDVLNLETNCPYDERGYCRTGDDLTGSEVFADRLIAVFGGSEATNAPNTNHCSASGVPGETGTCWDGTTPCQDNSDCEDFITCCADHLEMQHFPLETWGRRYIATKSYDRNQESDVWRIMAQRDGTTVETIPHQLTIPPLARGEFVDFESAGHFEIRSNYAVLVGQFLAAEQAPDPNLRGREEPGDAGTGDPAFLLAVPVEQYMSRYVVLSPDEYAFDYASVTAPLGTKVLLDGAEIPPGSFEPVGDGEFVVARIPVDDGVHTFASVPGPGQAKAPGIGVILYGWDQYVSYAYPGGLNLNLINTCRVDSDCPLSASCVDGECQGQ